MTSSGSFTSAPVTTSDVLAFPSLIRCVTSLSSRTSCGVFRHEAKSFSQ
jgi:hypothetical protein